MVVRDDFGHILDINQTSSTQLYEQHVQATSRIRRATVSVIYHHLAGSFKYKFIDEYNDRSDIKDNQQIFAQSAHFRA